MLIVYILSACLPLAIAASTCSSSSYKCGDLCTWEKWDCSCGNVTLTKTSPQHCCLAAGDTCAHEGIFSHGVYEDAWNPVCSNGRAVDKTELCDGDGSCYEGWSLCGDTCTENTSPCLAWNRRGECPEHFKKQTDAAGRLSCYSEDCAQDEGWYWCGDICTEKTVPCQCGDTELGYWYTQHYCCVPPRAGRHCALQDGRIVCSTGRALHKSEPCNGECQEYVETEVAGHSHTCGYTDHCNYEKGSDDDSPYFMCGSVCTYPGLACTCGPATLRWNSTEYCCVEPGPGQLCTHTGFDHGDARDPVCPTGHPVPKSSPCQGVCYNDYHHSKYLGRDTHIACAGDNNCVRVEDKIRMCQGVFGICSEAAEECDEQLRCHPDGSLQRMTSLGGPHFFCSRDSSLNTRTYENIDRSDENLVENIVLQSAGFSNIAIDNCTKYDGSYPALYCNQDCKANYEWCRSDGFQTTCTTLDNVTLQTDDPLLCGDHQFWRQQHIQYYDQKEWNVLWYGRFCSGTSHHGVHPWYYYFAGEPGYWLKVLMNCQDRSDRIHHVGTTCPPQTLFLQIHNTLFPDDKLNGSWLAERTGQEYQYDPLSTGYEYQYDPNFEDPHGCQDSCSSPGPFCAACSNPNYFTCSKSGVCIHPELLCDGHPQCEFGEDEAISTCLDIWFHYKIVSRSATLECSSRQYPGSPILATPCDGIVECLNFEDELSCQNQTLSYYLLAGTIILMLTVYLALKYYWKTEETNYKPPSMRLMSIARVLEDFAEHRDNPQIVAKVNTFLFHVIETLPSDTTNNVCKRFYELEAKIHQNDESKIFHSFHRLLHPLLVQKISVAQFPGLKGKCINCMESLFCYRWVTKLQNLMIRTPWMSRTFATIRTMFKISSAYADMFKDTFLTVSLMRINGGPRNVLLYPTQFTSVISMGLCVSIILPLMASSLHLVLNNPTMLFSLEARRSVTMLTCFLCSMVAPILLINKHEVWKENMRIMAQNNSLDRRILGVSRSLTKIKYQLIEFMKIELGMYVAYLEFKAEMLFNFYPTICRLGGLLPNGITNQYTPTHEN